VQQGTVDSKSIESTFDLFDTNHNGMITSDELIAQILYIRSGVQIIPINLIQNTENDVNMV
jgi:Ca2+-binding EF-hand superfamily protein